MSNRFPQPDNEDSFEKFSLAFLKRHWNNPRLELYAHRGQKQHGIDIFDPSYHSPFRGAQCKHHKRQATISPTEIRSEVNKALEFKPPLEHYAILTTAQALKQADDTVLEINQEHRGKNLFAVEILDWPKIEDLLDDYPDVADLLVPVRNSQLTALTTELHYGVQGVTARLEAIQVSVERSSHDSEIDEAQEHLDAHNTQVAQALFEKLKKRRWDELTPSQKYRVLAGLAQISLSQGKDHEAGKLLLSAKEANPESERARINEAIGNEFLGERETAHSIASRLRETYPSSGKLAACWIRTHPSESDPEKLKQHISPAALEDAEVWLALALRAMRQRRYDKAQEYAKKALTIKDSWVGPHLLHGHACVQGEVEKAKKGYWMDHPPCSPDKLKEGIISLDRAVELAKEENAYHTVAEALVYRALAKSLLGDEDHADDDFAEAVRLVPNDPGILLGYSQHLRDRERYDQAIKALRKVAQGTGSIEAKHHLASVLAHRNKAEDKREAAAIFREIAYSVVGQPLPSLNLVTPEQLESIIQNAFHVTVDNLLEQGETTLLEEFLSKLPRDRFSEVALGTVRSKIASCRADHDEARKLALEAAKTVADLIPKVDIRALATLLMKLECHKEALPLWERICMVGDYVSDVGHLIRCAERVDQQDVILKTCRAIREAGVDDPWLIRKELDVLQSSDINQAISILQDYLSRHPGDLVLRLRLTLIGLEHHRPELVDARPEVIPRVDDVTPDSGAMAINVLCKSGQAMEAVRYAYDLYRRFNDDPVANMALVTTVFAVDTPEPDIVQPEEVGPGCAVRYLEEARPEAWLVLEDSREPNRALGEFPLDDPVAVGLLGKRLGDTFTLGIGPTRDRTAVINECVSKYVYRARYIADNWQVRFRDYPWICMFPTVRPNPVTGENEPDFTDMHLVADQSFERQKAAEEEYKAGRLTTHAYAHNAGFNDFEACLLLATRSDLEVHCWSGDYADWSHAVEALANCSQVVLDISALATLYLLSEDAILQRWQGSLVVSQSTMIKLRECLRDVPGRRQPDARFGKSHGGYFFVPRAEDTDRNYHTHLAEFISLVAEKTEVHGCEELVYLPPDKRQTLSAVFGQHGLESMLLSRRPGSLLWSDDQMLTAIAKAELGVRCVWTQASVEYGLSQGFLDTSCAQSVGAKLLGFDYRSTMFNELVIAQAAHIAEWDPDRWPFTQALGHFSDRALNDMEIGRLALALLYNLYKEVALPTIRQAVLIRIAKHLSSRRDGLVFVSALIRVLPKRFGLDVVHLQEATEVLSAWLAEKSRFPDYTVPSLLVVPSRNPPSA